MAMLAVAESSPPDPVFPPSRKTTTNESLPLKCVVGRYTSPSNAALRSARLPITVKEAEPLAPEVTVSPVVGLNVSVPCATLSATDIMPLDASQSVIEIAFQFDVENVNGIFSFVETMPGVESTG